MTTISVYFRRKLCFSGTIREPIFFGRRDPRNGNIWSLSSTIAIPDGNFHPSVAHYSGKPIPKLIVADIMETEIPRTFGLIVPEPDGSNIIANIHSRNTLPIRHHPTLDPGQVIKSDGELVLVLNEATILCVASSTSIPSNPFDSPSAEFRSLSAGVAQLPVHSGTMSISIQQVIDDSSGRSADIVHLIRQVLGVLVEAATSEAFFESAARATGEIAGLDETLVLLFKDSKWTTQCSWRNPNSISRTSLEKADKQVSMRLLQRLLEKKQTQIFEPNVSVKADESLRLIERAVVAPIFDRDESIVGAMYGYRHFGMGLNAGAITDIEAALVEVVAQSVSAGLARLQQEKHRIRLSQFFSPRISAKILDDPNLLRGQNAEVTVLFCDIRGFSSVAEQLGAALTLEWINEVMTKLSQCVLRHDGVLVDYVGDELFAMWGAPGDQAGHADLACRAAFEMLNAIEPLRQRWSKQVGCSFSFGIGINSGQAIVGNTGSDVKFKYGPIGNTVNIGSRVQGATKWLRVPAIATQATISACSDSYNRRRLCCAKVVGIEQPLTFYELISPNDADTIRLIPKYEGALEAFDHNQLADVIRILGEILEEFPNDGPSKQLLSRAAIFLSDPSTPFDPIWRLSAK